MKLFLLSLLVPLLFAAFSVAAVDPDTHESCEFWASAGECKKNPNYMLVNCQTSCHEVSSGVVRAKMPKTFYDIVEEDIDGNKVEFEKFQGKVVYLVNVASQCGYTEQNYRQLKALEKYRSAGLELVIAPCNQFGRQEPGEPSEIAAFAKRKGFNGIILKKDDVNGAHARLSFQYLKLVTNKSHIEWNFDGKFLVDRTGNVFIPGDNLEEEIQQLLTEPLPDDML